MDSFAAELRRLRRESGLSYRALAERSHYGKSYLQELEAGRKRPSATLAAQLDRALGGGGRLTAALRTPPPDDAEGEVEAIELARRVSASDVGTETLERLELASDALAMAYATTPPADLLPRVRLHLQYVSRLLDARKTLAEHQRLLAVGGWFALLRATLHIDLRQRAAAAGYLRTAAGLAEQAGHRELSAWCLETRAWDALTDGDHRRALALSQQARALAPAGSSAEVQAAAQEGRAWARLGVEAATRHALGAVERLAGRRPAPVNPEHHYQYDPAKAHAYTATTLAWAGDPAAEDVARAVIVELDADGARPRRVAAARLDLALALVTAGKPDEAAATALRAITSGRIVPSNWWRVTEILAGVGDSGITEARDLYDAVETFRPTH